MMRFPRWTPPWLFTNSREAAAAAALPVGLPAGEGGFMNGIYIKNKWLPYLLIAPCFLLICLFKILPMADSLIQGFRLNDEWSLKTYTLLFRDRTFWKSLWVTLRLNLVMIPLQIVVALIMALMVNVNLKGVGVFRTVLYLPFCVSLTISTLIWETMLSNNHGVVNSVLGMLGIPSQGFLIDKKWAWLSIILIASWRGCAYWMMFILAGLKNISPEIRESAMMDGAGFFNRLFRITIPLLKHVLLFVVIANTTANFLLFAPVQIATEGGPQGSTNVLMYEAYKSVFKYSNRSRGACIVSVLLVIIVVVCVIQAHVMSEKEG